MARAIALLLACVCLCASALIEEPDDDYVDDSLTHSATDEEISFEESSGTVTPGSASEEAGSNPTTSSLADPITETGEAAAEGEQTEASDEHGHQETAEEKRARMRKAAQEYREHQRLLLKKKKAKNEGTVESPEDEQPAQQGRTLQKQKVAPEERTQDQEVRECPNYLTSIQKRDVGTAE